MASYTDRFGQGMMPMFNIAPGATTPLDVGADAAATEAAYRDAIAQRNATNESNIAAFNTGIESLRDLMSDEDQEEELLQDMITSAVVPELNANVLSDEDTGKFESGQTMGEEFKQAVTNTLGLNEEGQALVQSVMDTGEGAIDYLKDKGDMFYGPLAPIMPKLRDYYDTAGAYIEDAAKAGSNLFLDKLINPYINDPYELFEYDNTETGNPIFLEGINTGIPGAPKKADGGRIGFEEGGGLFERTSQIPEMFTTDELPSDPLSQIVKIGMAVRAPLLDVVEMLGLGAKESARIVSDLVKQGYDVTKPIRDVAGDAIADTAEFIQEDARDMGRFMSPTYYADRFIVPALRGEEARTDTETRLRKDLSDRGRSSATQERTERLKQKLFEETFGKDTQGKSALARPVEIDLGDDIRVNYNTGGLAYAYNPFMNMQQGFDYYNQFGSPVFPDIPTESPVEEVDPITTTPAIPGDVKPLGPQRGPEDRGSYADRFPSAEDYGYGYSGIPGEGGAATFNNPNFGSSVLGQGTGDTFTAGPGIGNAYDEYGRLRDIGVLNDLGLNVYGAAYPAAKAITDAPVPGIIGLLGSFFGFNKQKEEDEQYAKTTFEKTTQTMLDNYKKQKEIEAKAAKEKEDQLAEEAAIARAELEAIAKENKGKDEKAFQSGTGFTSDLAADTATGKFSNAKKDKNKNNKGNFGGPSGHGSGKQGGKHGPAGGDRGRNTGTSRF